MKTDKMQLSNVTLVAVSSVHMYETVRALLYSIKDIEFGEVLLLSHKRPFYLPASIHFKKIDRLCNIDDYSHFCVYSLGDYIDTEYALIVHHDGFVVNPRAWRDEFLNYDYVGSPWPLPKDSKRYRDEHGNIVRVGNGVSLRSTKLLAYPSKVGLKWEKTDSGDYNEDCFICCKNKILLETEGFRFAPLEIAVLFGREHTIPENEGIEPFLFHQWRGVNSKYPRFINVPEKIIHKLQRVIRSVMRK